MSERSQHQADSATQRLAAELVGLRGQDLSEADREQVCRLLLDHCGVAYAGASLPWSLGLRRWAARFDGTGRAPLLGTFMRVAPSVAGLVNGTAAHGYEMDDTHDPSMSHPGAVVISAALAVGSDRAASGLDVMAAIVAGYEAMARIGEAAGANHVIEGGFHPTALFGGFGAAAAAARLMGCDATTLLTAWGHVLSLAGGSMQFSDERAGTAVKRVHAGYAAQHGIMAAELAAEGVSAPQDALEGKFGLLALFGHDTDATRLGRLGGEGWAVHRISFKPYPCCRLFHSLIDGLRELTGGFELPPQRITRVTVGGPSVLAQQHMMRRPTSVMAAQYSLPFVVGATLLHGDAQLGLYRDDRLADPAILGLADRVDCVADRDLEASYPAHFGTSVSIECEGGEPLATRVLDSVGTPANPMTQHQLRTKAADLVRSVAPSFDLDALSAAIWQLPDAPGLEMLNAALLGEAAPL